MKKLRLLALLLVATVPFAACDDDGTTEPDPGSIQGTVVVEGSPLAGVTVAISGPESATATTDSNGQYSFQSVEAGSYTVEISGIPNDVTFGTVSKSATVQGNQTSTIDFSGDYIRTAVISGKVTAQTESGEANVAGITVELSGTESATTQTDQNGEFTFDGLRAGSYTVSIDAEGLEINFDRTSQQVQVSVGGTANVQFTGIQPQQAHVTINTITGPFGGNVNRQNVAGIIYVNVNVEPGTQNVSRVSVALDGEEVASQDVSISGGSSSPAAAAPETVQFQINTAMFDQQTLEVMWPNGQYELSATVETADGGSSTATLGTPLTFNNPDVIRVVHLEGDNAVMGGVRWFGNTDQKMRADAIIYDDQVEVTAIGVTGFRGVAGNGNQAIDLGAGPGNELLIQGPGPFEFTMEAEDNSPASGGVPGGVEDASGNSPSVIRITSVNNADGVDIIGNIPAGNQIPFAAPLDFTAPVVNTPLASNLTVNTANPVTAAPTVINTAAGAAAAPGVFFSTGGFGLTNSSENGIGGTTRTFEVDDQATSADPDFSDVSGIGGLAERIAAQYQVEITGMVDALGNAVDFATNSVDGGDNTSAGFGVDKGAPTVTNILPTAGQQIILNTNDPDGNNDHTPSFTVNDPNLADGNPGSGVNPPVPTAQAVQASTGTSRAVNFTNPQQNDFQFSLAQAAFPADDGYTVTMTQTDNAIAFNTTTTVWQIVLDGTAPTTTMLNPPSSSVSTTNTNLTFTIEGSATDANGLSQVLVTVREDLNGDNDGDGSVCELGDPLVTNTGVGATGNMTTASFDVTASASSISQQVTVSNPSGQAGYTNPQTLCFYIESDDNAKDVNGNLEPNTSDESARTDVTWN